MKKIIFVITLSIILYSCTSAPTAQEAPYQYVSNETPTSRATSDNNDRMVAYTVNISLSVKSIDETQKILSEQVKNNNGYITKEADNYIITRIPTAAMDDFIKNVKMLGKVENENKTGKDITEAYRDNTIKLENLKNIRNRYIALLEKANTVTDILSIEKELERVNTEIEILEGKIKYAEQSVTYSNITINFYEKSKPGPVGWVFYGIYRGLKWLFVWN
jgi:hypothetical protein